jgi:amino acid transporter
LRWPEFDGEWLGNHYGPFLFLAFLATTASLGILLVYMLVAAGGALMFWRERRTAGHRYNVVLDALLPLVSIVICGYTIYKSIEPVPPHPIDEAPYLAGGWIVIGLVVLLWLRRKSPDRVRRFGEALGEGESVAPDEQPAPAI